MTAERRDQIRELLKDLDGHSHWRGKSEHNNNSFVEALQEIEEILDADEQTELASEMAQWQARNQCKS